MACLTGGDAGVWAIGVNNQLYRLTPRGFDRTAALPDRWDYVAGDDTVFGVCEKRVFSPMESDDSVAELPAVPRQIALDGNALVMAGFEGGLYAFDRDVGRWQQYRLPRLKGRPVYCREFSVRGSRVLIRDGQGRLLLTDRRRKAIPQTMNLDGGTGPRS